MQSMHEDFYKDAPYSVWSTVWAVSAKVPGAQLQLSKKDMAELYYTYMVSLVNVVYDAF